MRDAIPTGQALREFSRRLFTTVHAIVVVEHPQAPDNPESFRHAMS